MRDRRTAGIGALAVVAIVSLWILGVPWAEAWRLLPKRGTFYYPRIDGVGYLVTEEPESIGRIVTARAEKGVLIGENVIVYLNVGERQGIRVGDRLVAFSVLSPRDLKRYKVLSIEGWLRIVEVGQEESAALVEEAYKSLSLGSRVTRYHPLDPNIPLQRAPESIGGRIIWTYEGLITFGEGDLVFLDRGLVDGVAPGQCYQIYRVPMEGTEPPIPYLKRKYHTEAPAPQEHLTTPIGEMVVVRTQEATAVALVTDSLLPMERGDRYRAGCDWEMELAQRGTEAPGQVAPSVPAKPAPAPEAAEDALQKAMQQFENVDVHFAFDSFALDETAQKILGEKARFLKDHPSIQVFIEGHCDERGTEQYNLALGDRRSHAAKQYLVGLGVSEDRFRTVSYGEEKPLDPGHNEGAWARNRRAHFVIQNP